MDAALESPAVLQYFKIFLTREFNAENIAFWEEVEQYRSKFRHDAEHIFDTYVSESAVRQVNLPHTLRKSTQDTMVINDFYIYIYEKKKMNREQRGYTLCNSLFFSASILFCVA